MTLIKQMVTKNIWTALTICAALSIFGISQRAVAQNTFPNPGPGNVGIGTTSPTDPLHVSSASGVNIRSTDSTYNVSSYLTQINQWSAWQINRNPITGAKPDSGRTAAGIYFSAASGDSSIHFQTSTTNGADPTERMVIDKNGNVGIGTTSPGQLLELKAASPVLRFNYTSGAAYDFQGPAVQRVDTANTNTIFRILPHGTGADFSSSGVGHLMGQFQIFGTDYAADQTNAEYLSINAWSGAEAFSGTNGFSFNSNSSGTGTLRPITFAMNGDTKVFIGTNGNVGMGTTAPGSAYKLDVAGTINATGLNISGSPIAGSVFGRTGAVVAATNDYTWAQIDKTTSSLANLTTRSAGDLSSGTLPDARFPATLPAASGTNLTSLNASSLASGTVAAARLGSETADTTTFLRGDNTWAVPSGGSQWTTTGGTTTITYAAGNVGIGTTTPNSNYKLDITGNENVTGNLNATGTITGGNIVAKYQDLAEWVPSSEQLPAGTVVVLDSTKSNQVTSSTISYDTRVAGVISEQPGIALGERSANKVLVATTGRVRVKVDATRAPIHVGDLLVTSDVPGVAMKSEPVNLGGVQLHRPGTLIGKALEPLAKGSGEILVLLSLQ